MSETAIRTVRDDVIRYAERHALHRDAPADCGNKCIEEFSRILDTLHDAAYSEGFHDGRNEGWQDAMEAEHPREDDDE